MSVNVLFLCATIYVTVSIPDLCLCILGIPFLLIELNNSALHSNVTRICCFRQQMQRAIPHYSSNAKLPAIAIVLILRYPLGQRNPPAPVVVIASEAANKALYD